MSAQNEDLRLTPVCTGRASVTLAPPLPPSESELTSQTLSLCLPPSPSIPPSFPSLSSSSGGSSETETRCSPTGPLPGFVASCPLEEEDVEDVEPSPPTPPAVFQKPTRHTRAQTHRVKLTQPPATEAKLIFFPVEKWFLSLLEAPLSAFQGHKVYTTLFLP